MDTILNNISTSLQSAYTAGSGSLALATGYGSTITSRIAAEGQPSISATNPIRVTVATNDDTYTVFLCTGLSGDTLTGTVVEGTDQPYPSGTAVQSRLTSTQFRAVQGPITGTAGETIAAPAVAYQDVFGVRGTVGLWYNADNAAANPVKLSPVVGFATSSAVAGGTFAIQQRGVSAGWSGLTTGQPVYLGTAGGLTQTRPASTGSQVAALGVATALSASTVAIAFESSARFALYEASMGAGATATVYGWPDAAARSRRPAAYNTITTGPASGSPAVAQSGYNSNQYTASTQSASLSANPTIGNMIVVYVVYDGANTSCTLSDTIGSTYAQNVATYNATSSMGAAIFSAPVTTSGSLQCTVTFSGSVSARVIVLAEVSGISALDQTGVAAGTGTTATVSTGSTANPNEYVGAVIAIPAGDGFSATTITGYTNLVEYASGNGVPSFIVADKIVPATGVQSASLALSGSYAWTALMATFAKNTALTNPYDSPVTLGNWLANAAATDRILCRYADASGLNPSTATTFSNTLGSAYNLTFEVEQPLWRG